MMEEYSGESHEVTEKVGNMAIAEQLQDAAGTNVTMATPQKEPTPPIASGAPSPLTSIAPPVALPQSLSTPPRQMSPPYVPPALGTPPRQVSPPTGPAMGGAPPRGMSPPSGPGGSPPPPTTGFVPSKGTVSAHPHLHYQAAPEVLPGGTSPPPASSPASFQMPATPASSYQPQAPPSGATYQNPNVYSSPPDYSQPSQYQAQTPPGAMQSPYEASISLQGEPESVGPVYPAPGEQNQGSWGMGSWLSGGLVGKVMEKTMSTMEKVITTMDPGMKDVLQSGGDLNIVVASAKEVKIAPVRDAFQEVFGKATVTGLDSQPTIAPQPVGFRSGLQGCEERIENLRRGGLVAENQVLVAVENFIVDALPDTWVDIPCLLLKDPINNIQLQAFGQATPIPAEYVTQAQDQTPSDYDRRWSGLAVTVGQVISRSMPHVDHADWHGHFTGVSRKEMIYSAAKMLAGLYKRKIYAYGS